MILDSRKWDARYGHGLLAAYGPTYTSYIAITSPSAWAVVEQFFPNPPRQLEFQHGMAEGYVEPLIERLPDADVVLGIGGGNALDVGKYVAWKLNKPLVLIPTIVSTGAIFQAPVAIRRADIWEFCFDTVAPDYLATRLRRDRGGAAASQPSRHGRMHLQPGAHRIVALVGGAGPGRPAHGIKRRRMRR